MINISPNDITQLGKAFHDLIEQSKKLSDIFTKSFKVDKVGDTKEVNVNLMNVTTLVVKSMVMPSGKGKGLPIAETALAAHSLIEKNFLEGLGRYHWESTKFAHTLKSSSEASDTDKKMAKLLEPFHMIGAVGATKARLNLPTPAEESKESAVGGIGGIMSSTLGKIGLAAGALIFVFKNLISIGYKFVQALNPAVAMRFQIALNDLGATVGLAFEPLIDALIPIIYEIADIIAPAMRQLGPPLADLARATFDLLRPVLNIGIAAINTVSALVAVTALLIRVWNMLNPLARFNGRVPGAGHAVAARQASIMGGADIQRSFDTGAFGSGLDPLQRTADATEESRNILDRISGFIENINPLSRGLRGIAEAMSDEPDPAMVPAQGGF